MNLSDDDFTLFALPRRQALDRAELDARRRDLQAQVHPDRFAAEGAAAQRLAMQWAVRVNEAYTILKDPLRRAECLCGLRGVPVQAEVHPDRFAAQGDAAQRLAMQWAVRVNEAHARLKDPLRRGAYLCELAGVPIDAERNTASISLTWLMSN